MDHVKALERLNIEQQRPEISCLDFKDNQIGHEIACSESHVVYLAEMQRLFGLLSNKESTADPSLVISPRIIPISSLPRARSPSLTARIRLDALRQAHGGRKLALFKVHVTNHRSS